MRQSKSRKHAKKKCDKYFSEYIRKRDADHRGLCQCITCGRWDHWKNMDAGHFIARDKAATRYDERNVHAQCKHCNRFQSGKQFEHAKAVDKIHGAGTADELLDKSKMRCKRTKSDLEWLASEFKNKAEQYSVPEGV